MKKTILYAVIAILLLLISGKLYSLDFNFARDHLNHYNGIITDFNDVSYYFTADLINCNIMNTDSGLGLFVSPFRYSFISRPHPQTQSLSFVNIKVYYNIIERKTNYYNEVEDIIGPFFSLSWMNLKNYDEFDPGNVIYSAGLLFSMRIFSGDSSHNVKSFLHQPEINNYVTFELGYINNYGHSNFYAGIQISSPSMVLSTIGYYLYAMLENFPVQKNSLTKGMHRIL
jgi:hypothetical protein